MQGPRVTEVTAIPLLGETPDTGWAQGTDPDENMHTLIELRTDAGVTGWGSAYNSLALIEGGLKLLRPLLIGETVEPERVSEKLSQMTFWQGRGGAVTHAISGNSSSAHRLPPRPRQLCRRDSRSLTPATRRPSEPGSPKDESSLPDRSNCWAKSRRASSRSTRASAR